jgi:uncharacterized protein (TIGR00297 family)
VFADDRLTLAPLTNFDIGALASGALCYAAWRLNALTSSGALLAFLVGTFTFAALGGTGAAVLLTFFVTSVALSFLRRARAGPAQTEKHGPRDGMQVFANGGVAALCALGILWVSPHYNVGFAGALAAANADTWGTELGILLGGKPRSILTFRPIEPGLSGGITLAGTLAEIAGALVIAGVAYAAGLRFFVAIACAGIAGALVDSLLGASLQVLRWCPQCQIACETEPHTCGANTRIVRGSGWFGNDAVNFAATLTGALVGYALAR